MDWVTLHSPSAKKDKGGNITLPEVNLFGKVKKGYLCMLIDTYFPSFTGKHSAVCFHEAGFEWPWPQPHWPAADAAAAPAEVHALQTAPAVPEPLPLPFGSIS